MEAAHRSTAAEPGTDPGNLGSRPPLREVVQQRIQRLIIDGTLEPGQRIVETTLAERLGVSRGPVREALQLLGRDGWVDHIPRRGTYVHVPSDREIDDFFEMRTLVEGFAAAKAARRHDPTLDAAATLEATLERARVAVERADGPKIAEINATFHGSVTVLAGNEVLQHVTRSLGGRSRWFFSPLVNVIAERAYREHCAIMDAIRAGDPEAARTAAELHVDGARRSYHELRESRS